MMVKSDGLDFRSRPELSATELSTTEQSLFVVVFCPEGEVCNVLSEVNPGSLNWPTAAGSA